MISERTAFLRIFAAFWMKNSSENSFVEDKSYDRKESLLITNWDESYPGEIDSKEHS